jgi:hypothetical protein
MKRPSLTHLAVLTLFVLAVVGVVHAVPDGGTTFNEQFTGGHHHYYGGMAVFENTVANQLDTANAWHLIYTSGEWSAGILNGMTYQDGASDTVSDAYANPGGGRVTVTAAAHPFTEGEIVSITGSTNYNSIYEVEAPVTADTFTITATFAAEAAAGVITRGGNITITNAGTYKAVYHISEAPDTNNDVLDFVLYQNATILGFTESRHESKTAGKYSTVAGCGIFTASAGDIISPAMKNVTSADDVTIRYAHVSIFQM